MKILLVNSRYAPFSSGGADISTRKLAVELHNRGNDVEILTCNDDNIDDMCDGIVVHRRRFKNIDSWYNYDNLGMVKKLIFKTLDIYNVVNSEEIKSILSEVKPDVVHTNNINGITPVIWTLCNHMKIPIVHTCRDYFLMCPHTTLMHKDGRTCDNSKLVCRVYRIINAELSKRVDCVTAPSEYTLNRFLDAGFFKGVETHRIYNAIDVDINYTMKLLQERKERHSKKFRFIYLGALEKHKGVDVLLDAIRSNSNMNFSISFAGRGTLEEKIKLVSLDDERVDFLGFIENDLLEYTMENSDALICPSNWPEPFGRVVIDAYKFAMPVISTSLGGLDEIVCKETGIKVEAGRSEEISKAIDRMMSDRDTYIQMCSNAVDYVQEFLIEKQTEAFENLYRILTE